MRAASVLTVVLTLACATVDRPKRTVLFVCPHGGAKSVIAAAYFNRAASRAGLAWRADAVAAETPYDAVPTAVAELLARDGLDVASFTPRPAAPTDLEWAAAIVAIDCDVAAARVEKWDDVPKVSEDLIGSAAAIRRHVDVLVAALRR